MTSSALTVVIGAGISGLTCAYALKKAGQNVLILEAADRPGGVINTIQDHGYLLELGPQSFSGTEPLFRLCDELGIAEQLIEAPRGAPRYVYVDGKLRAVPFSPGAFLSSSLFSWRTKFFILTEPFRTSPPPGEDESVADFVRSRFTVELLDRLVGPFVSGIFAGDPEQLSLHAAFPKIYQAQKLSGSIVRGSFLLAKRNKPVKPSSRRAGLYSFRDGNVSLIRGLASFLGNSLRLKTTVGSPISREDSHFRLNLESSAGCEELVADILVLATPTFRNFDLLRELSPNTSLPFQKIDYAPIHVVSHGYHRNQIGADLRGFGFLIPRSQNLQTLGTVWNSSLFPGRAPADHVLLTSFIGGASPQKLALADPNESARTVQAETARILRISGIPSIERVTEYPAAIPQYNLGHLQRLQAIRYAVAKVPGLWLAGNYWNGPSIGACVEHSLAVADAVRIG